MESNSNNKQKVSNFEKGLKLVREGNLHQADICFDAEMTQSNRPNFNVFIYHGHLLNRLGRYDEAIAKFNSFLNNHDKDVSCLFGKGISNIGLLNLDDALSFFDEVIDIYPSHAEAYFYSSIIYFYPSYQNYNLSKAKDAYEKYQKFREDFFNNNQEYFDLLGDDLSKEKLSEYYDEIHKFYKLSDSFKVLNQLLERECADNSNEYYYKQLCLLNDADEKEVEDLFKIVGYDEKLIDDLNSKFKLKIEDKRTLNKILYSSKDYDISFRDLHNLIRVNIIDGNESIVSFYEKLEDFINSSINEKNREFNRVEGDNEKLKKEIEGLKEDNEFFVNENMEKNNQIKVLKGECGQLSNQLNNSMGEIKVLKEKCVELSNQLNNSIDNKKSIFGDDFKNANSLNMISGIYHEDYKKDLNVLVSKKNISEEECNIFESAFEEYYADNFNEAYEHFKKVSDNFKSPQNHINFLKYKAFLKATSLSCDNKFQEAYKEIHLDFKTNKKLGAYYNKDKYPILWFNFGNIYFDYANSQSCDKPEKAFSLAYFCYNNAKNIVSRKKSKSNYEFNFKDEKSKKDFENDVQMMYQRVVICKSLLEIEKLKHKNES